MCITIETDEDVQCLGSTDTLFVTLVDVAPPAAAVSQRRAQPKAAAQPEVLLLTFGCSTIAISHVCKTCLFVLVLALVLVFIIEPFI